MRVIDIETWSRKQLFQHFMGLNDPSFAVTFEVEVAKAYEFSKSNTVAFFGRYLHDCMRAINDIENFKFRIQGDNVVMYDVIHASATIARPDNSFGFSFIPFNDDLKLFLKNLHKEKERIQKSNELYPPLNGNDCIHCSALPWLPFTSHKEPVSGKMESIPEVAFSKVISNNGRLTMNVSVKVKHALVDGYHVGQFYEKFQYFLNE